MTLISSGGRPRPKHSRALTAAVFRSRQPSGGMEGDCATRRCVTMSFLSLRPNSPHERARGGLRTLLRTCRLTQSSTGEKGPHRVQPQYVRPPRAGSCGEAGRELIGPVHQVIGPPVTLISSGGRPRPKHSRALTAVCFGRGNHPAVWKAIGATDGASRCAFLA